MKLNCSSEFAGYIVMTTATLYHKGRGNGGR